MKIRWNDFPGLALLLIVLIAPANVQSQEDSLRVNGDSLKNRENLFDTAHSLRFADYLFKTGQYDFATEEYQRVIFLRPADPYPKIQTVKAREAQKDYQGALNYFAMYFPVFDTLKPSLQKEDIRLYVLTDDYSTAGYFVKKSALVPAEKKTWTLGLMALEKKWDHAWAYYRRYADSVSHPVFHQFGLAVENRLKQPHKSPVVAAGLSAVVPGLGKVYTKDYGDALMSFLFVGLNAWQAYRGFKKDGLQSTRGWIFAGIGASFYLGNVWGSAKAAKRFNRRFDKKTIDEIKTIMEYNL